MKATFFLVCVLLANGHQGVVVSRDIHDVHANRDWVIVETKDGDETAWLNEIKTTPCSEMKISSFKNADYIKAILQEDTENVLPDTEKPVDW